MLESVSPPTCIWDTGYSMAPQDKCNVFTVYVYSVIGYLVTVDSKFNALKYLNTNCQINSFVVMNNV
jgi:hypothetical protein